MMVFWGGIARCLVMAPILLMPLARGGVQGWAVTAMHLITLLAMAVFFLERITCWQWRWIRTPLDLPLAALLLICGLAALLSENRLRSGWVFLLCVNYVVLFYLMIHLFQTRAEMRQLMATLIVAAFLVVLVGGLTRWGIHPFGWWRFEDIHQAANKMTASFGNPNHFAGFMALSLPLALAGGLLVFRSRVRIGCYIVGLSIIGGLVLSLSRGGWMACLCGSLFLVCWLLGSRGIDKKKLLFAACGVTIVVFILIFSNTTVTLRLVTILQDPIQVLGGRLRLWGATATMIADYPILGVGPGNFGTVFTQYHPPGMLVRHFFAENDYLQWVAEIGVGAIGLIVWIVMAFLKRAIQKRNHPSRLVRGIAAGALSGMVAIGMHATVDFPFHIPAHALMATSMAALVMAPDPVDHKARFFYYLNFRL